MSAAQSRGGIRLAILGAGAAVGLGLAALGTGTTGATAGWLGPGAWVMPGVAGAVVMPRWSRWRPRDRRAVVGMVVAAWGPAALVTAATGLAAGVGVATWDPGGAGLRAWWVASQAGRAALEVSDLTTLSLGQLALVWTAPLYGLPMGLGGGAWAAALPGHLRVVAVAALGAGLAGLGAVPPGPAGSAVEVLAAGAAFGAFAAGLGRTGPWATVVGLAAIQGLPGLGPLLGLGPTWAVGWTAWGAVAAAAIVGAAIELRGRRNPGG